MKLSSQDTIARRKGLLSLSLSEQRDALKRAFYVPLGQPKTLGALTNPPPPQIHTHTSE